MAERAGAWAARWQRLWPWGLFIALVLVALGPALASGPLWSSRYDWRYFETMTEMARRTVADYHQAPLWNPYSCGGEVGLANPQAMDGAPTFLLVLLLGTAWGFKAALLCYLVFALHGGYLLGRRLGLDPLPAALSGVSFGLSGYLALHLASGHINFAGVALYPYLIYCYDRALARWQWAIPAGALAAWIALLGGTFTPPMAGELLVLWATVSALLPEPAAASVPPSDPRAASAPPSDPRAASASDPRTASAPPSDPAAWSATQAGWRGVAARLFRNYGLLLLCALIALGLSAARMLPALEFIIDHPRAPFRRTPDVSTLPQLLTDLWFWRDFGPMPRRRYWSHEYTARLPALTAVLVLFTLPALLGLWLSIRADHLQVRSVLLALTPPFIGTLVMGLSVWSLQRALIYAGMPASLPRLLIEIGSGILLYTTYLRLLHRPLWQEATTWLAHRRHSQP